VTSVMPQRGLVSEEVAYKIQWIW